MRYLSRPITAASTTEAVRAGPGRAKPQGVPSRGAAGHTAAPAGGHKVAYTKLVVTSAVCQFTEPPSLRLNLKTAP